MTAVTDPATGLPITLRLRPVIELSDDQLLEFCQLNDELRIERLEDPETVSGDPVLPGLVLRPREVW